jgi:hypothetical protein
LWQHKNEEEEEEEEEEEDKTFWLFPGSYPRYVVAVYFSTMVLASTQQFCCSIYHLTTLKKKNSN